MFSILMEAAVRSLALGVLAWLVLKLWRMKHPQVGQVVWRAVLIAALSMPALMQQELFVLPAASPQFSIVQLDATVLPPADRVEWTAVALEIYAAVALVLLLRQIAGLARALRIRARAVPLHADWIGAADVRVSAELRAPATIASTILLPPDHVNWSEPQRAAVMAHEGTHVVNRDFLFQLLGQLHQVAFWFSPLAWLLPRLLGMASEQMSDDAAIREVGDRSAYAQQLIDFARGSQRSHSLVSMARPATMAKRIERIVSEHALAAPFSGRHRMVLAAALIPVIAGVASCSADDKPQAREVEPQAQSAAAASPEPTAQLPDITAPPADARPPRSNKAFPLSQPVYPQQARSAGQTGTVVLQLHVLEDGSVDDVRIKQSSSFARLDYAAANESLNWKLDPGTVEGKPQAMWGQFAVTFKLDD